MTVFILPTKGNPNYRGKYPNRARMISGTASRGTGRHIELNDGTRLWSGDDRTPEFSAGSLNDDYAAIRDAAPRMSAAQYEKLREAAELSRSRVVDRLGPNEIERRVRALVAAISAPAAPEFVATPEHIAAMQVCNAWDSFLDSEGDDRRPQPPHVVAAIAVLDTLEESEIDAVVEAVAALTPAVVVATRRDNTEYHKGLAAGRAGLPESANPYTDYGTGNDSRYARWLLGREEGRPPRFPAPTGSMAAALAGSR